MRTLLIEQLADVQHQIWVSWMKYLFSVSTKNEDGSVTIPVDKVERWKNQVETKYFDLSELEQQSDKEQVYRYVNLVKGRDE